MSLKEVCRACLRSDHATHSLLDSIVPKVDSPPDSVVDLWKIFTRILEAIEDSYPNEICTDCSVEIQRMYSYMLKCERSKDILIKKMKTVIPLKRLRTVSTLLKPDSTRNKSENDMDQHISQIKTENLWNENDEGDVAKEQFDVIIQSNGDSQVDTPSEYILIVQPENDNFAIEILDNLDCENVVIKDEATQHIKQEPELNICTETDEFDATKYEDQCDTEAVYCPSCRFECRTDSVEQHIIENHMKGQMCKICNQEFECSPVEHCSKHLLKSIAGRYHKGERPFKCKSCPEAFRFKSRLAQHSRRHTGERPFKCESCTKTFQYKSSLIVHLRLHTGEIPYKCEKCPKTFRSRSYLRVHSRCHTAERQFKCEICSSSFQRKSSLIFHSRFHTENRPFKCERCPKTFQHKSSLTFHSRLHTEYRPFKCERCPNTFQYKQNLIKHLKEHTREGPFKCEICSSIFHQESSLIIHLKCHTPEPFITDKFPKTYLRKDKHRKCDTSERT